MTLAAQREDDARFFELVPIGRACGIMRTGAYGEANRRTSSVLGDAVNLNAFVPPRPTLC